MNVSSIGEYIRQQREQARISLRQLASSAGISNPYLSQIERGLRRPSAEILQQIAKALRISAEALYMQAGILEERPPDSGVRAAVLADPTLLERQKQVLLEIYESFRREARRSEQLGSTAEHAAHSEHLAHAEPAGRPEHPAQPAHAGQHAAAARGGDGSPGPGTGPAAARRADARAKATDGKPSRERKKDASHD
jgi:transcriptional regulator with XRE-family HTH domain